MSDDHDRRFDRPRVYAAALCFALCTLLLLVDAASPEYDVGEVTLSLLLGTGLVLLGIEAGDQWHR